MHSCPVLKTRLSSPNPQNASLQKDEEAACQCQGWLLCNGLAPYGTCSELGKAKGKIFFQGVEGERRLLWERQPQSHNNSHGRRPPEKKMEAIKACTLYCTPYCTSDGPTKQSAKGRDRTGLLVNCVSLLRYCCQELGAWLRPPISKLTYRCWSLKDAIPSLISAHLWSRSSTKVYKCGRVSRVVISARHSSEQVGTLVPNGKDAASNRCSVHPFQQVAVCTSYCTATCGSARQFVSDVVAFRLCHASLTCVSLWPSACPSETLI